MKFKLLIIFLFCPILLNSHSKWGFFAHQRINKHAVFILPAEILPFYKKNLTYIIEHSVDPDQRRYAVKDEAPRHFIDLDAYGDSAVSILPHYWKDAVEKMGEDSLNKHGIVPWHIQLMKFQLTEAFKIKDAYRILKLSAEIGHYIADANVPLHTTRNYNGQFTNQEGIHGFWESRLPELFSDEYDFFVGQAEYLPSTQNVAWQAVKNANACLDSVLNFENALTKNVKASKKYVVDTRKGQNIKTYSKEFSKKYHLMLENQVQRQMRASIKMIGNFWYTAWIDAGQPDLTPLLAFEKDEKVKKLEEEEKKTWFQKFFNVRTEN
ncbi:MAG: zinc dependent phospholipase C family protein [Bacteroidota bacterium]